ncbi:MAG: NUDIX domain-containing protein [Nostoc sp. ChiQUE01a]|uniref:NUDIX hydrolase n=1 Tax=Nostoc sp. CCY 9925 TaxID=3103865 RepID=UPI002AD9B2B3|nr:NUDIX domain-containing protein [Nostoc sp. ChiQUE01a]
MFIQDVAEMREAPGADIIILNRQQQVLLVLRDNKSSIPFPNTWALLGGYIEENESPEATIRRELVEEMELELGEIKFFKSYYWQECDEHIFWTQLDLDISQITLHEGQKLAYFSREEIKELEFASHYDQILAEFFDFLAMNLELSMG